MSACHNFLRQAELASTKEEVHNFLKQGNTCLKELPFIDKKNTAYLNLLSLEKNLDEQNIHWINILKRVFGKNNLGRNGIYFLEQVLIYWETKNDDILLMVSEEEKELVNSRI